MVVQRSFPRAFDVVSVGLLPSKWGFKSSEVLCQTMVCHIWLRMVGECETDSCWEDVGVDDRTWFVQIIVQFLLYCANNMSNSTLCSTMRRFVVHVTFVFMIVVGLSYFQVGTAVIHIGHVWKTVVVKRECFLMSFTVLRQQLNVYKHVQILWIKEHSRTCSVQYANFWLHAGRATRTTGNIMALHSRRRVFGRGKG